MTPIPIGDGAPELRELRPSFNGYGLGFGIRDYRGHKLVTHTGGLPGYVSKVAMIPDAQLGIAILTNQESGAAFESIVDHIFDAYLGAKTSDWIAAFQAIEKRPRTGLPAPSRPSTSARDAESKPSLPIQAYAGRYRDQWYGDIIVTAASGGLTIRFDKTPSLSGTLEHWQHDTFVAQMDRPRAAGRRLPDVRAQSRRHIDSARMQAVSPDTDFSFDFQDLLLRPAR